MKKFTLLPVGECFEYQGENYTKTGPLTASSLTGNRQRMIPRSALVKSLQQAEEARSPAQKEEINLRASLVREAFEHYHNGCLEWLRLAEQELNDNTAEQIRTALVQAHQRFLEDLQLNRA